MEKVLFIGGPGNLSENTVKLLLENPDNQIGIFTLPESPSKGLSGKVSFFRGNRDNEIELAQVIQTFQPDIIIDFVCFLPNQAKSIARLSEGKIKQFVFVSTCDVYGYPLSSLPMRENGQWVETNSPYAENKRLCEGIFNTYFQKGSLPLTIVRPSYSFGNDFVISFIARDGGKFLIPRLRAGKPIFVPGDGTTLMHASVAYNTGRMIGNIAGSYKTIGKSYTCGHETFTTHDRYIQLFADVLGVDPVLVHIPYDLMLATGCREVKESILEDVTRHNIAFSMDAFRADFPDFKWEMSLEEAARAYVTYNDERGLFPQADEEIFEDRLNQAWNQAASDFKKLL